MNCPNVTFISILDILAKIFFHPPDDIHTGVKRIQLHIPELLGNII